MNEQQFQSGLAELMGVIGCLPKVERAKLEKMAHETRECHARLNQGLNQLQETLDYLRLSMKYVIFDLEATRRENEYLRKMLNEIADND